MLLALYPIFIWLTTRTSVKWQKYQKDINEQQDIASGRFAESIGQVRVVKSFLQEIRELSFFSRRYEQVVATTYPQSRLWHRQDVIRRGVLNVIFLAVFAYIFIGAARGTYGIGTMVLLIQYAGLIRLPIFSISFLVDQSQRAVSNAKDYFEIMDQLPDVVDEAGASKMRVAKGEIAFHDVHFAYDNSKPVLRGISLRLAPGEKMALVGENGAGKSTLIKLLMRLYDPNEGSIRYGGVDLRDMDVRDLRDRIGVLFQDFVRYQWTARENVGVGWVPALGDKARIDHAVDDGGARSLIDQLPQKLDTMLGGWFEDGHELSGGQWQKIALARAFMRDSEVLVLDEPTAALDAEAEHELFVRLQQLAADRTAILISHRFSTVRQADRIAVIRDGRVEELGTHDELLAHNGRYAHLFKLQAAGYLA